MSKEKLFIDADLEGVILFGIVSNAKEYRLAWQINEFLNIDLELQEEKILSFKGDKSLTLLFYQSIEEYHKVKLIKNLAVENVDIKSPYLLPEMKNFDYLLMFEGEGLEESEVLLEIEVLKSASFIQYINNVELDKLKSVDNLMF
jgi:hypothetical protein